MMKIGEVLNWASGTLSEANILESDIESEIMLQKELNLSRTDLHLNFNKVISFDVECLKRKIMMRANHIPLAYILKEIQFMDFGLSVDERAMIPRQETEILVESVMSRVNSAPTILDIGTGCGNIAISLAKYVPHSRIYATDISNEALELARKNARQNEIPEHRISFLAGDLFEPLKELDFSGRSRLCKRKIDIIVSNPPYIPSGEIENLQREVHFEPRIALDGGFDGLEFYRRTISESPLYLKNGGYLFLEIGFNQAEEVRTLISKNRNFEESEVIKDYSGIDRVVRARVKTD